MTDAILFTMEGRCNAKSKKVLRKDHYRKKWLSGISEQIERSEEKHQKFNLHKMPKLLQVYIDLRKLDALQTMKTNQV